MVEEAEILSEADEIAALLPWYVSGKLNAADRARVDAYAVAHPEVQDQIALAREEADIVFADNQAIVVPHAALDKLIKTLEADPIVRLQSAKASLLDRIAEFLGSLTPRQLAYAGVAAALAIAIQTASIGSLLLHRPGGEGYQTASGARDVLGVGTFALVAFQPAAPAGTLSAFLADNSYVLVEGPKAGGMYRIRISDHLLDKPAADAAIAKLKARSDLVSFASSAPQTP